MNHTEPATLDELAALYLRARDVPCPGCGYNRRDGITAACPECQAVVQLATVDERVSTATAYSAAAVGVVLLCCTLFVSSVFLYLVVRYRMSEAEWIGLLLLAGSIGSIALGVKRSLRCQASRMDRDLRRFLDFISITSILLTSGIVVILWADVF